MLLVVCGCSWSCRDPQYPDIEFGQKVADHFNYEYKNIATKSDATKPNRLIVIHTIPLYNPIKDEAENIVKIIISKIVNVII